jgi:hypothetical protein
MQISVEQLYLKRSFLVPVKKQTTTFELTDNDLQNPVKLTWNIECNATAMYPVPVSIMNNG